MLKIAVIVESSPFDRKGLFNAVHNRIRHLRATGECEIDAYCIHSHDNAFTRRVRHNPQVPFIEETVVDDVRYRLLWYDFSLIDHILVHKLHWKPLFFAGFMSRCVDLFKGYDCISAHSFTGALFASEVSSRFGIPYLVTWHGSEIHTHPWRNPMILRDTRSLMEGAACNFFVSKALLKDSDRINPSVRKEVLYNGVSSVFTRFSAEKRVALRAGYGISEGDKVVAYAGSIVAVKNVLLLQPVFHSIQAGYGSPLKFWMIGDGKLRPQVQKAMTDDSSIDVRFWGNIPAEEMPFLLNCVDVLLLPSLNEGLGMIGAEAIRCGASVAGTDVGGIPEVIGGENTVPLGDGLIDGLSGKALSMLRNPRSQSLPPELDWASTASKELAVIKEIL
ncbi:MAG: glycosyltransferase [Bacteroidales bacterium]|nr:glycosyltransferase [Bacteroidales bacterium]